jgi:hypothetical protein
MIRMEVSAPDLKDLAAALKLEAGGQVMRRDLVRALKVAIKPAVAQAKASILSMPAGTSHRGAPLRRAVARQITTEVALTQRRALVKVKVRRRNMPRGFSNAPKNLSESGGWRHPVFPQPGRKVAWVRQIGKPGWFDQPMRAHQAEYRAAIQKVMEDTANRIARRT